MSAFRPLLSPPQLLPLLLLLLQKKVSEKMLRVAASHRLAQRILNSFLGFRLMHGFANVDDTSITGYVVLLNRLGLNLIQKDHRKIFLLQTLTIFGGSNAPSVSHAGWLAGWLLTVCCCCCCCCCRRRWLLLVDSENAHGEDEIRAIRSVKRLIVDSTRNGQALIGYAVVIVN